MTKPTATQRLSTQGGVSVSGDVLVPLLHRVRLNGSEWRIVVAVLISSRPVSARELALGLRLDYGFVKRIVRGLVAWRILSATPKCLLFDGVARAQRRADRHLMRANQVLTSPIVCS